MLKKIFKVINLISNKLKVSFSLLVILSLISMILEMFSIGMIIPLLNVAIGNDTGPMHLFGLVGCKTLVFFTKHSNPELCAPRGSNVKIIFFDGDKKKLIDETKSLLN